MIEKISIMEEMVVDPKANLKITDVQSILRQAREMLEKAIVPPCKVGDTVYVLSNGMIMQTKVIEVKYQEEAENYGKFIRERIYAVICNVLREFNFSDFGKTKMPSRQCPLRHSRYKPFLCCHSLRKHFYKFERGCLGYFPE